MVRAAVANGTECRLQTFPNQLGSSRAAIIFDRFSQILVLIITDAYVPDERDGYLFKNRIHYA